MNKVAKKEIDTKAFINLLKHTIATTSYSIY